MEPEFFLRKMDLDYGDESAVSDLKKISQKILELKGWPEDKRAYWNGEALFWRNQISKEKRAFISQELNFFNSGKNLDLGCGSYSYISSVGLDISEKMLKLNDNLIERIVGDLEQELPFNNQQFDSVTLIFVLNYVKNYSQLLAEVSRVLKSNGQLVVVQPKNPVNSWQLQKVVNPFSLEDWKNVLGQNFSVEFYEKEELGFFVCDNRF